MKVVTMTFEVLCEPREQYSTVSAIKKVASQGGFRLLTASRPRLEEPAKAGAASCGSQNEQNRNGE